MFGRAGKLKKSFAPDMHYRLLSKMVSLVFSLEKHIRRVA